MSPPSNLPFLKDALILVLDNGDIKVNEMQTQCSSGTYLARKTNV